MCFVYFITVLLICIVHKRAVQNVSAVVYSLVMASRRQRMEHAVMEQLEESVVELRQGLKRRLDALTSPTAPADALPHASSRGVSKT